MSRAFYENEHGPLVFLGNGLKNLPIASQGLFGEQAGPNLINTNLMSGIRHFTARNQYGAGDSINNYGLEYILPAEFILRTDLYRVHPVLYAKRTLQTGINDGYSGGLNKVSSVQDLPLTNQVSYSAEMDMRSKDRAYQIPCIPVKYLDSERLNSDFKNSLQ